ncbi:DAHP synthetase [Armillaria mellea]|nr:DAHP synthetase [Armillaria mellea]
MAREIPWHVHMTERSPLSWKSKLIAQDVPYPNPYQLSNLIQWNEAFLLHAGDCMKSFDACIQQNISAKIGLILSFSLILIWSSPTETINGKCLFSIYSDTELFLGAAHLGFASLHHPKDWSFNHVGLPTLRNEFELIVDGLSKALSFSRTIGAERSAPFEQGGADQLRSGHCNTSAHCLWIGDRTRQLDGTHVQCFRGICNSIGIKVWSSMAHDQLAELLDGIITIISQYGAEKINAHLPGHIEAVKHSGHPVIWICDASMYGNTFTSSTGYKTRHVSMTIGEITLCLRIHASTRSRLDGTSLEFAGELIDKGFSMTQGLGGSMELSKDQLGLRHQGMKHVALLLANYFKDARRGKQVCNDQDLVCS